MCIMANVLNSFSVNIPHINMTPIAAFNSGYELEKESVKFWLIPRPHSGGSCNWGPLYQHNGNPLCQLTSRHRWLRFVCNFGRVATSSPHPHLYIVYIYILNKGRMWGGKAGAEEAAAAAAVPHSTWFSCYSRPPAVAFLWIIIVRRLQEQHAHCSCLALSFPPVNPSLSLPVWPSLSLRAAAAVDIESQEGGLRWVAQEGQAGPKKS